MSIGRVVLLLLFVLTVTGCGRATFVVGLGPGDQRLTETQVLRDGRWGSRKVALIDVSGLLTNTTRRGLLNTEPNPVSSFAEALNRAAADRDVAAVVVRINSPGGTVTASELMYGELVRFRETTGKPAVAVMMDLATSGGYYLACGSDVIFAQPTTITGSVGVILQTVSVKPALERWGVSLDAITSGPNKDAGSPLSDLSPEQRETLAVMVDDFYAGFLRVVRQHRTEIPEEHFAQATDGRVVTGRKALEWQLVDRLGGIHDAFDEAKRLAGVTHADLVRYHRPLDQPGSAYASSGVLAGASETRAVQLNLLQLNLTEATPGFGLPPGAYYVWTGEAP